MAGMRLLLKEALQDDVEGPVLVARAREAVPGEAKRPRGKAAAAAVDGRGLNAAQRLWLEGYAWKEK